MFRMLILICNEQKRPIKEAFGDLDNLDENLAQALQARIATLEKSLGYNPFATYVAEAKQTQHAKKAQKEGSECDRLVEMLGTVVEKKAFATSS